MRDCESLSRCSDVSSACFERAELPPQCGNLLIEHFDLRQGARGDALLGIELAAKLADLALRVGGAGADAVVETFVSVALAFSGAEIGL